MPELPEVESIKLQLQKYLVGHTIRKVELHAPKIFTGRVEDLEGSKVVGVRRFAKVLSIDLANGNSVVFHIKLTGQFIYRGKNLPNPPEISKKVVGGAPGKHTRITFILDDNSFLYYNDIRMFGWAKVVDSEKLKTDDEFIKKLGPEPFVDLTIEHFRKVASKTRRPIKVLIMDQTKLGGVGNIYANDALWLAKIHPNKPSNILNEDEIKVLYDSIHKVLKEGLKHGGASELAFVTPDGTEGEYQRYSLAYGKNKVLCTRCKKGMFEKYFLGGRGTYICPECQKLDG